MYKSKAQREAEKLAAAMPEESTMEEDIEELRAKLPPGGTPVTKETFEKWKKDRDARKAAALEAEAALHEEEKSIEEEIEEQVRASARELWLVAAACTASSPHPLVLLSARPCSVRA